MTKMKEKLKITFKMHNFAKKNIMFTVSWTIIYSFVLKKFLALQNYFCSTEASQTEVGNCCPETDKGYQETDKECPDTDIGCPETDKLCPETGS